VQLLYLTHPKEDYLQDQILIGLRRLLGSDCVDYPHKDVLYRSCSRPSSDLYGRGFTVWKTLDDEDIDRTTALSDLQDGRFDLVIFGSIWRQPNLFNQFEEIDLFSAEDTRSAFLDGEDRPSSPPDFVDRGKISSSGFCLDMLLVLNTSTFSMTSRVRSRTQSARRFSNTVRM
jgi:hypothetical protein